MVLGDPYESVMQPLPKGVNHEPDSWFYGSTHLHLSQAPPLLPPAPAYTSFFICCMHAGSLKEMSFENQWARESI